MNTDDIDLFIEIYKSQNLTTAANVLYLTQPTVSRRLSALESELGYSLFVRGKGYDAVSLTEAGKQFYAIAQQMSRLKKEAYSIKEYADTHHFSVATTDSIATYPLRDFFNTLSHEKKNWEIDLTLSDSIEIFESVSKHITDVGITNGSSPLSDLISIPLFVEEFVVIRRGQCPTESGTIHPTELDEKHEISQIFGNEHRYWHDSWWPTGMPKSRVNMAHFTVSFLNDPEDWAMVPLSVAQQLLPPDGYLLRLQENPPKRRCFLILHKKARLDRQNEIREFYERIKKYILGSGTLQPSIEDQSASQ